MSNDIVTVQRMFNAPLEPIYRALTEADALVKWLAPKGFIAKIHQFNLQEGGHYNIEMINFISQQSYRLTGTFLEIIPGQKVRYRDESYELDNEVEKTIECQPSFMGTTVTITQQGINQNRPLEAYFVDWQDSLYLLSLLVEV